MAARASEAVIQTPASHLPTIGRLQRLLEKEKAAYRALETYEQEFREFRTMQAANRINVAEAGARRASEDVQACIALWRDSLVAA